MNKNWGRSESKAFDIFIVFRGKTTKPLRNKIRQIDMKIRKGSKKDFLVHNCFDFCFLFAKNLNELLLEKYHKTTDR